MLLSPLLRAQDRPAVALATGRAARTTNRRLNVKDSLMVRRDGPTTPATVRQHERQLPLLLDMFHNQSCKQVDMEICSLLLG